MDIASTSFVLGYHGCNRGLAERIFAARETLRASHNDYDWLGDGIYFWEYNSQRAFQFASEASKRRTTTSRARPRFAVVGAIIDLGFCLNLLDARYIEMVRAAYQALARASAENQMPLPLNTGGSDLLKRKLDCAVLRTLHQRREDAGTTPFQTVRAAFVEGDRLYENAGFSSKNHIQICVRDPRCIKGYFRPIDEMGRPLSFA